MTLGKRKQTKVSLQNYVNGSLIYVYYYLGLVQLILFCHLSSLCIFFPSYIEKLGEHQPLIPGERKWSVGLLWTLLEAETCTYI